MGRPLPEFRAHYAARTKEGGWGELMRIVPADELGELYSYEDISVNGKCMWKVLGWSQPIGKNYNPPTRIRHSEQEMEWYYAKYPKLRDLAMPTCGGHAEYVSIKAHELEKVKLGLEEQLVIPSRIVKKQVLHDLKQMPLFRGKQLRHDVYDLARAFTECINGKESILPPESGPGFPYQLKHAKNSSMLMYVQDLFALVVHRFTCLTNVLSGGVEWWNFSPEEAVRRGLCDPIKVFIKNEPTKISKLDKGVARLIWNLSLVDQICGKMLTKHMDNDFVKNWDKVHSKSGMPMDLEGFTKLFEIIESWELLASTDNSMYDYTVTFKELMADGLRRCALLGYKIDEGRSVLDNIKIVMESDSWHMKMLILQMFFRAQCIVVLSSGLVLQQEFQGHQKSGDITTSSGNGANKSMGHGTVLESMGVAWNPSEIMTMGDDCAFNGAGIDGETYVEKNRLMHKKIKEIVMSEDEFNFCSTLFSRSHRTAVYTNPAKAIMQYFTAMHPNESQVHAVIDQIGDVEFAKSPLFKDVVYAQEYAAQWERETEKWNELFDEDDERHT